MNRTSTIVCVWLCTAALSGCATSYSKDAKATADDSLISLYDGEPEVVFATEFPVASAEDAIARADRALQGGDTDLALYMYVRAYDLDRENVYALARIGEIHESRGNEKLASMAFTRVLQLDPAHAGALESLGMIYLQANRHEEALALFEQAVIEDPSLWRAHNGIGVIADIKGDHARAIEAYDGALLTNPGKASVDALLLNNRGYSRYLAGQYEAASADLLAAATRGAERATLNLGLVRARQKQYAEAVQLMAQTIELEVAYNDVGYIAMRQGDLDIAETYFRKAIELSPRYFEAAQRNMTELRGRNIAEANVILDAGEAG